MSEPNYKQCKSRGTITVIGRGGNGNQVLIEYDNLPEKYKQKVQELYGNPYEYLRKSLIKQYLNTDFQARKFYTAFVTEDGKALPSNIIEGYVIASQWCNMLIKMQDNGKKALNSLGMTKHEFWEATSELIKAEKIELPGAYAKLLEKVRKYREEGYRALVSKKFGNNNSVKVKNELNKAMLLEMLAHHNQFDDVFIALKYNQWAVANQFPTITGATVGNYRRKHEYAISGSRYGNESTYNKFGKHIKQMRPTAPLLLINSDDNVLDLYFQEQRLNKNGHSPTNYYFRYTLIVIMDSFNDYILGYAAGETPTEELVKEAYRNAVHHVKELTGEWNLWHQIKTDHWGLKALKPFYEQQANFTPATARVARGKYIEQAFGQKWHQTLKHFNNYAGHNITAKSKLNAQAIQEHKRDFPTKEEGLQQIQEFINAMRQLIDDKTGKTRQEIWLDGITNCPQERKRIMNDTERLLWFGKKHNHTNRLTNGGLLITIDGYRYEYELNEADYMKNVGKQVQVNYDPYDMSMVLAVNEKEGLRLVCKEYEKMPSALADFKPGDRAKLNARLDEKKRQVIAIGELTEQRKQLLYREKIDAQSVLQAGVLVKELKQSAEKSYLGSSSIQDDDEDYNVMKEI